MDEKLKDLLFKAKTLIVTGQYNDGENLLSQLKNEYPDSIDIDRLWCALAMRTQRMTEVISRAESIYTKPNGRIS